MFVEARNGSIVAVVDTFTGRYAVRTADDKNILFYRDGGVTSFINVKLGNRVYTSNGLPGYGTPEGTRSLGKGKVTYDSSRIVYEWDVNYYEGSWHVTQELTPEVNDDMHEVKVKVEVKNTGNASMSAGIVIVHDIEVNGNDGALPIIDNKEIAYEQNISPIPDSWSAQGYIGVRDKVIGRLRGGGLTPPDRFIAGHYTPNGRLGGASFNYIPDNVRIKDCALLMQWDEEQLAVNSTKSSTTAVGFEIPRFKTFGKDFVVSAFMTEPLHWFFNGAFTLISDITANVKLKVIKEKNTIYEKDITLQPNVPAIINIDSSLWIDPALFPPPDKLSDHEVSWLYPFRIQSDAEIGIIAASQRDVTSVMPSSVLGKEYIIPGGFDRFDFQVVSLSDSTSVTITPTISGGISSPNPSISSILRGVPFTKKLQESEEFDVRLLWVNDLWRLTHYRYSFYPFEFGDGSGTEIISTSPIKISLFSHANIVNVDANRIPLPAPPCLVLSGDFSHVEEVLPIEDWGKEYFCVPFLRPTARRPGDYFKILVLENSTDLTMDGISFPKKFNKGDYIDTLSNIPLYITANKPIAVYQYATHSDFALADSIGGKAMCAVYPREYWGKKYFCVEDVWDNVIPKRKGASCWPKWYKPKYEFITVICKKNEKNLINIDSALVNPSDFIDVGEFSYLRIDSFKRFRLIESSKPIFVQVYGWHDITGYAYVPPFK